MGLLTIALLVVLAAVLVAPFGAEGGPAGKVYRVGVLSTPPDFSVGRVGSAVQRTFSEDCPTPASPRDARIERRYAPDDPVKLRNAADDLLSAGVDVLVALGSAAAEAARDATDTVPIVMLTRSDPVAQGLVQSLDRPGGNVTGLTTLSPVLARGRLALLREAVPGLSRVSVLWSGNPAAAGELRHTEAEAGRLGIAVVPVEAPDGGALVPAFETIAGTGSDAVIVLSDGVMVRHADALANLAATHRIPVMYADEYFVSSGGRGLMSFGPTVDVADRLAAYVDRVRSGDAPAELAIGTATKFDLVVNLAAAREIGVTIPPALLLQADQVIR